jgi:hypothetical protein
MRLSSSSTYGYFNILCAIFYCISYDYLFIVFNLIKLNYMGHHFNTRTNGETGYFYVGYIVEYVHNCGQFISKHDLQ